jgi:hypothetical protein
VQGRKRVLYGFLPISAVLVLISIGIVGTEGMLSYPHYVLHLEDRMAQGAILPSDMPNLRGVLYVLLHVKSYMLLTVLVSSVAVLFFAAWRCRTGSDFFDLKFSLASVATVLVSYHALGYDLSLLMLPILLIVNELLGKEKVSELSDFIIIAAIAVLFFSPIQFFLLMRSNLLALMGWAVLLLLCGIAAQIPIMPPLLKDRIGTASWHTSQKQAGL